MENYKNLLKETKLNIKNLNKKLEINKNKKFVLKALINYKKDLSELFDSDGELLEDEYEPTVIKINNDIDNLNDMLSDLDHELKMV
jgi:hypothetical protein